MIYRPDPARSRAVLIGVSEYADPARWPHLPAVARNVADLRAQLLDPQMWGLDPRHCVTLDNPSDPGAVLDAIVTAAQDADDTVLVYYSGHGTLDDAQLLLTLSATTTVNKAYRSVAFGALRTVLRERRAQHAVVLLDCCFSGAAHAMSDVESFVDAQLAESSAYVLTSSARDQQSLAPPGARHTAFTGHLLELLAGGLPGAGEWLAMSDLMPALRRRLVDSGFPAPRDSRVSYGDRLALFRNRHLVPATPPRPSPVSPPKAPPETNGTLTVVWPDVRSRLTIAAAAVFIFAGDLNNATPLLRMGGENPVVVVAHRVAPSVRTMLAAQDRRGRFVVAEAGGLGLVNLTRSGCFDVTRQGWPSNADITLTVRADVVIEQRRMSLQLLRG